MSSGGQKVEKLFFDHFSVPGGDPDLEMLKVVISHYSKIPYENITKVISKFSSKDPDDRLRDPYTVLGGYIDSRTGGTCFSLTWCLGAILSGAGFICYPVMADMKRPNVHCALVVHLGSRRFLVDPGYLLGEPVELTSSPALVETTFGKVELRPRGSASYNLYTITGSERKLRYRVRTTPVSRPQFMKYWQDSFSLPMMNSLQLTRLSERGHLYIRDHHLRLRRQDLKLNENIRQGYEARIEREFGIPVEITAEAKEMIERMKSEWRTRKQEGRRKGLR